jgi:hypothetical protein
MKPGQRVRYNNPVVRTTPDESFEVLECTCERCSKGLSVLTDKVSDYDDGETNSETHISTYVLEVVEERREAFMVHFLWAGQTNE